MMNKNGAAAAASSADDVKGKMATSLQTMKMTIDVHVGRDADALRACMSANGLSKDAEAWRNSAVKSAQKLSGALEAVRGSNISILATMDAALSAIKVTSEGVGNFYDIMSKKSVMDVMGRKCFDAFSPFLRHLFKKSAEAMRVTKQIVNPR